MNRVDNLRIRLPQQFSAQSTLITDRVREGLQARQWRGQIHLDQLELGVIQATRHTTADELVSEILSRIDRQMELYR